MKGKKQYLAALPHFPNSKGFNHRTILVSAININDARALIRHLRPNDNIGEIKEVTRATYVTIEGMLDER